MPKKNYEAILFDLDGTLIDSAPDLAQALNNILIAHKRPAIDFSIIRGLVSYGSTRMLNLAFPDFSEDEISNIRPDFLKQYKLLNHVQTEYFVGIVELIERIKKADIKFGIVTNKPTDCTIACVSKLGLDKLADAIVCGDTLPVAKPDPSSLFLACEMMNVDARNCVYIGDCVRDIIAGKAAAMDTIACAYGYIGEDDVNGWSADFIAQKPTDIINYL